MVLCQSGYPQDMRVRLARINLRSESARAPCRQELGAWSGRYRIGILVTDGSNILPSVDYPPETLHWRLWGIGR